MHRHLFRNNSNHWLWETWKILFVLHPINSEDWCRWSAILCSSVNIGLRWRNNILRHFGQHPNITGPEEVVEIFDAVRVFHIFGDIFYNRSNYLRYNARLYISCYLSSNWKVAGSERSSLQYVLSKSLLHHKTPHWCAGYVDPYLDCDNDCLFYCRTGKWLW